MKLTKNVDGDWPTSKQLLRQDLDTIQRNINQILAQINAIEADTPVPPATISSAVTVTTYGADPLTSVATDPRGALLGKGTITDPLAVNVDGSTMSINSSNQLVSSGLSSVAVSGSGAITGDGTGGSPLAVAVDGATITIVGNQLVAAGGANSISVASVTIADAAILTANTVPIQILSAASAGSYYEIVFGTLHFHNSGTRSYNSSTSASLFYAQGSTLATNPISTFGQFHAVTFNSYWDFATRVALLIQLTGAGENPDGGRIYLKASANSTATGAGLNSCTVHVGYITRTSP